MSRVQTLTVTDDEAGMRVDRWFRAHFPQVTHGQLEKFLRKGEVRVSGGRVKSNRRLEAGESVRVPPLPDNARRATPKTSEEDRKTIAAMTIFEDAEILALNKPFGLAVQGGAKTARHVDGMLASVGEGDARPRLVHRLDKDTGGLLLVAKTRRAAQYLTEQFRRGDVEKTYWTLVAGRPHPPEGTIDLAIAKQSTQAGAREVERMAPMRGDGAKRAVSHFQTVEAAGPVSFLAMRPVTGRTHQLRVHAAAIGCPVVGDGKYGGEAALIEGVSTKLHLFCRSMSFAHPKTQNKMTLAAPLSGHMKETWKFFAFDARATVEWPEEAS